MDFREIYNSLPLSERQTGVFSELSVCLYHSFLKSDFIKEFKKSTKKLLISCFVGCLCMSVAVMFMYSASGDETAKSIDWLIAIFGVSISTAIGMTLARIAQYPTRKIALNELIMIHCSNYSGELKA